MRLYVYDMLGKWWEAAGEMAALLFQGTGSISSTHITRWLTTPVTPVPDLKPSSGLHKYFTHAVHRHTHNFFLFLFLSQYLSHLAQDDPEPRQPWTSGSPDSTTPMLDYRHVQLCPVSCCTRDWPQDSVQARRALFNSTVSLFSSQTIRPTTTVIIQVFITQIYLLSINMVQTLRWSRKLTGKLAEVEMTREPQTTETILRLQLIRSRASCGRKQDGGKGRVKDTESLLMITRNLQDTRGIIHTHRLSSLDSQMWIPVMITWIPTCGQWLLCCISPHTHTTLLSGYYTVHYHIHTELYTVYYHIHIQLY